MSLYAVCAQRPQYITVADKPLNLGGKVMHMPIDAFEKRFGCVYNDGIDIASGIQIGQFNENITGDLTASHLKQQIEKILRISNDNLAICDMGAWGQGVFALKEIPKDTVLAIFGGTLTSGNKVADEQEYGCQYYGSQLMFSTMNHRGIASFMQHLPEELKYPDAKSFACVLRSCGQNVSEERLKLHIELYGTRFDPEFRARLATENIRKEYVNYNGVPVIAVVSNRPIKVGEPVGFNYGFLYWESRRVAPEFFDKNGNTLSHRVYKRTFGRLNFEDFSYTGEYRPLIDSLNKGQTAVRIIGDDQRTHEMSWVRLAEALIQVNACELIVQPCAMPHYLPQPAIHSL